MKRVLLSVVGLTSALGCFDGDAPRQQSTAEQRVRERAAVDATLKAHQQKGAPEPLGELKEFDESLDGGIPAGSVREKLPPEPPRALTQPDPQTLLRAWRHAKSGDFVTLQCSHFVNMYGNRVRRRVQLRLEVADMDARSVILRVRASGVEEHDSTNPATKRKQWSAQFKGAAELVMQREVDPKLGEPLPARNLAEPLDRELALGKLKIAARCARSKASTEADPRDRCVAADTEKLYLTAGLLSEVGLLTSNGCKVTGVGNSAPASHSPTDLDSTKYVFTERGDGKFRERTQSAAAGVVKIELQGLRYLRASEAGSVTWNGKHYAPGVVDTRKQHVLDWALQRVMPEFPQQLATE